eukprot:CAMPEP_0172487198 /NCGR_PEP_ID=MMETSP1066-20121228/16163_1 /TAXON_ID=671091 /ORGANISM="Coscinodiscus wailesii, Strain CCMP2513" /LENGTH=336 /DNA_ID=CAMNT_0013253653 /DNA_START=154 /DNA_END=1164 /DNA_ORIENTATION=+
MISNRLLRSFYSRQGCLRNTAHRHSFTTKTAQTRRRRRRVAGVIGDKSTRQQKPFDALLPVDRTPFRPSQDNIDSYLEEASLSPWVPTPDPIARRMLQIAEAGNNDVHYDLGSGDGRLNFMAIDFPFNVKRSVGIEVDEELLKSCEERLMKRHPRPTNLQFVKNDIMSDDVDLEGCTILTMYFVEESLQKLKPILEKKLGGTGCKVITNGYTMKGWEPSWVEIMLGLPMHMYVMDENLHNTTDHLIADESHDDVPVELDANDEPVIPYTAYGLKKQEEPDDVEPDDSYESYIKAEEEDELSDDWWLHDDDDDDDDDDDSNSEEDQDEKSKEARWKF